jgi:hypothetical protein
MRSDIANSPERGRLLTNEPGSPIGCVKAAMQPREGLFLSPSSDFGFSIN